MDSDLSLLPVLPVDGRTAGTYDFCATCPAHLNCCSRVQSGGAIDTPVAMTDEISKLADFTGLDRQSFSNQPDIAGSEVSKLKTGASGSGCIFFDGYQCTVYEVRPFDCRLFPLDVIVDEDGQLCWIAYTTLCPIDVDLRRYLDHAESLLAPMLPHILEYANYRPIGMARQPFRKLKVIDLPSR